MAGGVGGGARGLAGTGPVLDILRDLLPKGKLIVPPRAVVYREGSKTAMRLLDRIAERSSAPGRVPTFVAPSPEMSVELLALPAGGAGPRRWRWPSTSSARDTPGLGAWLGDAPSAGRPAFDPEALAVEAAEEAYHASLKRWYEGWGADPGGPQRRRGCPRSCVAPRRGRRERRWCRCRRGWVQEAIDAGPDGEARRAVTGRPRPSAGTACLGSWTGAMGELARAGGHGGDGRAARGQLDRVNANAHLTMLEAQLGATTTIPDLIRRRLDAGMMEWGEKKAAVADLRAYASAIVSAPSGSGGRRDVRGGGGGSWGTVRRPSASTS